MIIADSVEYRCNSYSRKTYFKRITKDVATSKTLRKTKRKFSTMCHLNGLTIGCSTLTPQSMKIFVNNHHRGDYHSGIQREESVSDIDHGVERNLHHINHTTRALQSLDLNRD